MIKALITLASN